MASASNGESPAYMAWKEKIRCNDAEPRLLDDARAPAGNGVTLDDDDVMTAAGS
jgi:hypothetical protein